MLNEPIKKWDIFGILCGLGGMLMLVQPFKGASAEADNLNFSWKNDLIGCFLGLLAAFCASLAMIYLKKLSSETHFSLVTFYYMVGSSILSPVWSQFILSKQTV